jgi:predicted transcriptional regulator
MRSATLGEIYDAVSEETEWSYSTVKTLLRRLVEKGYVRGEPGRYARTYKPRVSRSVAAKRMISELLDPLLGGSYGPLASYLATTDHFTDQEIEELRRILRKRS